MNEPRQPNVAGTATLVIAGLLYPVVLYFLLSGVVFGNLFTGIMDRVYGSIGAAALYFSVFFALSVGVFRNPHMVSAAFAVWMFIVFVTFIYVMFQALASI
jgi:hypothetical protein